MVIDLKKLQRENKQLKNKDKKERKTKLERIVPQAKKFMFNQNQATIILKEKEIEPPRSLFFKDEFIKEKSSDLRFLS